MDKTVPKGAAILLDFIYRTETKTAPPACYDVIYGHNQAKLAKPLTSMTLGEVIEQQKRWTRRFRSSAAGAPQFMRATLQGLVKELGLSLSLRLDPNLQDRLAFHLLKRRGYDAFMSGMISRTEFGKRLAMEWASFPVLKATRGDKREVKRGQSYYAGDGLNKALVAPAEVEAVLDRVKAARGASAPASVEMAPETYTDRTTVEIVQRKLHELGYTEVGSRRRDGSFDGVLGSMTKAAILIFRADNGLPAVDVVDRQLLDALDTAKPRRLARNDAPPEVVRQSVPEVRTNFWMKLSGFLGTIFAAIGAFFNGILGNIGAARGYIDPLIERFADVPGWVWFLLFAAVCIGLTLIARHGEQKGIAAYQSGERR